MFNSTYKKVFFFVFFFLSGINYVSADIGTTTATTTLRSSVSTTTTQIVNISSRLKTQVCTGSNPVNAFNLTPTLVSAPFLFKTQTCDNIYENFTSTSTSLSTTTLATTTATSLLLFTSSSTLQVPQVITFPSTTTFQNINDQTYSFFLLLAIFTIILFTIIHLLRFFYARK